MTHVYAVFGITFGGDIFNHFILVGPKRVHSPSFPQILVCLPSCVPQLAKIATWQKSTFPLFFLSRHYTLFFFPFSSDSGFSLRFLQEMGCGQLKKCSQGHKINYRNRIHNDRASVGAAAPSTFAMKTDNNCMYLLFSVSSTSSGLGHLTLDSL